MKKTIIAAGLATLLTASVQADTLLGLYIGGHVWDVQTTGTFGEKSSTSGEVISQNFNFDDQQQGSFYIALEHPIPLIPNIKISSTVLDTDGQTTITEDDFSFGDISYPVDTTVDTVFDVSYIDYTFYYEILDNDLITFDIGITARDIDGNISITDDIGVLSLSNEEFTAVVPMLYGSAIIGLPFTGFNVFAQGNYTGYDDSSIYDFQAGVSYALLDNLAVDLDLEIGYKVVKMDIEDIDDVYADMEFKGIFAGATVHF
ncbi:TIGR04219 family outer membrane beta-barrel protein [Candidatus Colwellia aromaticivorans]|uniref:TIGR04219 family outer membrane beta-barrel protein n=1 Tax=Candidatus Colwellia aromaticivorans TaxID=2267621 RepID=UPI000DF15424|nr:TIGR04219 family outer membrane beta-barrel protein [Candidatus Colwellia aromaticivorans]